MSEHGHAVNFDFFCDFDGTISENDMIAQIMMEFAPDEAAPVIKRILAKELSVQAGVETLFGFLPSRKLPEIERFAIEATRIRPGFAEFVALCKQRGWRLTVVSGGFDFFVKAALKPHLQDIQVFCNRVDASGDYLKVVWDVACESPCTGGCGLCKPTVIRRVARPSAAKIVIGDSVTDLKAANLADYVFARDKLLVECQQRRYAHSPFETFFDIARVLGNPNSEVYQLCKVQ
jgi:2-hydroxy-3-keto-5-methylthiopentenyl-1-phosphate phosphatase